MGTSTQSKFAASVGATRARAGRVPYCTVALGGAALLVGLASYNYYRRPAPEPPALAIEEVEPAVLAVIKDAYGEVYHSPWSAVAWGRLGMVLLAHDFFREANACLSHAERLNPQEPRWPYYQGIALALGDPDAAIPKLQRAAELATPVPDAPRLRFAEVLLGQGRSAEAADQFRVVLQDDPTNPRAHLGLARVFYEQDDLANSLAHLRRCAENPFTRKAAATLRAEAEQRMSPKNVLARDSNQAAGLPDDPAWPDPFVEEIEQLKRGRQGTLARMERLLAQNCLAEAVHLLRKQVHDAPSSDWAWLWLGRLLLRQEEFAAAEHALREAVRQAPESVESPFYLGVALFCQGKSRDAAPYFRQATERKPDYALAHYNLGHCLMQQGDQDGAVAAFRTAVRCKVNFADAHTNLGDVLMRKGRFTEGLVHLRHSVGLNPGDARANRLLRQAFRQVIGSISP